MVCTSGELHVGCQNGCHILSFRMGSLTPPPLIKLLTQMFLCNSEKSPSVMWSEVHFHMVLTDDISVMYLNIYKQK